MLGIIGGGLSGVSLGYFVKDAQILEKSNLIGGLLSSIREEGFTFDLAGGHILFSRNNDVLEFMKKILADNLVTRRRNTKVYYKGLHVKYPFENGLSDLPLQENYECLMDFIKTAIKAGKGEIPKPENFKEWIYQTYGEGIAEKYLIPYNRKIWKYDPAKMSIHWVYDRIPMPPIEDVIKGSLGLESEGYTHQLNFFYPRYGGIQSLIEKLAAKQKIITNFNVEHIEKKNKTWAVSDGEQTIYYEDIVSTIPLPDLIKCLDDVPRKVRDATNNLKYNSLITVMLGFNHKVSDLSWLYFPGDEIFHRLNFVSNFSDKVTPPGKSSMIAEITYQKGDKTDMMSDSEVLETTLSQIDQKIASKDDVCYSKVNRVKYAYVVYDIDYPENIELIRTFLQERGIKTLGRFAKWEYYNMDACISSSMELSKELHT